MRRFGVQGLFFFASLALVWLSKDKLGGLDLSEIRQMVLSFSWTDWFIAASFTAFSFRAVAQYDRLAAAWLGLRLPQNRLTSAGWRATAIGQTLGLGLVTGSLVRWRLLGDKEGNSGVTLFQAGQITSAVCALFFFGAGATSALSLLIFPIEIAGVRAIACLCVVAALAALLICASPVQAKFRLPPLRIATAAILFAGLDTAAAAGVIYVFLPEGQVAFTILFPAFLLAMFAGMVSSIPGGLGPFEVALIALLPFADASALVAALCAYRAIYFAVPALIAAPALLANGRPAPITETGRTSTQVPFDRARPDLSLLATEGWERVGPSGGPDLAMRYSTPNSDLILGDPLVTSASAIAWLSEEANSQGRAVTLYKCSAKGAGLARRWGFKILKIGAEAIIDVESFAIDIPSRRQLRRKLRKAKDVEICEAGASWTELSRVDQSWQDRSGKARGFSMGRLSQHLLQYQRIFTANLNGKLVAFVTFNTAQDAWELDLVRHSDECPDGAIHKLVVAALVAAKADGVSKVSLASAPFSEMSKTGPTVERILAQVFEKRPDLQGLRRFKQSFGPTWSPIYMASENSLAMCQASIDLYWRIQHPEELHKSENMQSAHENHAFNEFDSSDAAWQGAEASAR